MANNFQQWQGDWEDKVPDDIGHKISQQAQALSHFGRVIELFIPSALQTAAQLIAGTTQSGPRRPSGNSGRYSAPVIPEGRPPSSGGGSDGRLLPSDSEIPQ